MIFMISAAGITKRAIQSHYDLATPFYRLLWGPHIHHGLWDDADSTLAPRDAQLRLTETLADVGRLQAGDHVLDVGCGMGGSAIHLAKTRNCRVTGITLSGLQRRWAHTAAWWQGVAATTEFHRADVESEVFAPESFDVVWSIECTEHLADKPRFFEHAAAWLRPGGRVAICAWLAAEDASVNEAKRRQVEQVCEAFLCPSLGSFSDYSSWMEQAGLVVDETRDWTDRVARTWELCDSRVRAWGIDRLAPWIDPAQALFVDHFSTLLGAYRSGAMQYGCFLAHRPPAPPA